MVRFDIKGYKELIPWDNDLDIYIFQADEAKLIAASSLLQEYGYDIVGMPFGYRIYPSDGIALEKYP